MLKVVAVALVLQLIRGYDHHLVIHAVNAHQLHAAFVDVARLGIDVLSRAHQIDEGLLDHTPIPGARPLRVDMPTESPKKDHVPLHPAHVRGHGQRRFMHGRCLLTGDV